MLIRQAGREVHRRWRQSTSTILISWFPKGCLFKSLFTVREIGTEFGTNLMESKGHAEGVEADAISMEVNTAPPATSSVMPHQGGVLCFTQPRQSQFCLQIQEDKPFTENRLMDGAFF